MHPVPITLSYKRYIINKTFKKDLGCLFHVVQNACHYLKGFQPLTVLAV